GRAGAPQGLFGYAALRLAVDQAEPLGRVRYDDVIGDAEFRNEGEFLEDAYDACPRRIHRRRKADRLPIKADLAFVGCNDPRQYLDERRLARAVLAQQRVDASGRNGKVGPVQRPDAAIAFGDALHA